MDELTAAHREARLDFAYKNVNRDWQEVLFSGDIEIHSVKIWVCISFYWPPKMRIINVAQDSSIQYNAIFEDIVTPILNRDKDLAYMQVRNQYFFHFSHVLLRAFHLLYQR